MIWLKTVDSTNNYIKIHREAVPPYEIVVAYDQTAGRGQRGNTWESESGKNLTFSFHFEPGDIAPSMQFVISEAMALAVKKTLAQFGIDAKVKWPNDIYVGEKKICGILIENSIMGSRIIDCVVGAGINVNQERFFSDAPNPVSMKQLTGMEYHTEEVAQAMENNIRRYFSMLESEAGREEISSQYHDSLWRRDGRPHSFRDVATGREFYASILRVEPTGHLLLSEVATEAGMSSGELRYAFKEVTFILDPICY